MLNIGIINPSLLETGTNRGGGCEVTDYNVAMQLSKNFKVIIISPYYQKYVKWVKVKDNFFIFHPYFRALASYPIKSQLGLLLTLLKTYVFSLVAAIGILKIHREQRLDVIVVHNPQSGLIPMIVAKVIGIKVIFAEGNTTPWTNPYIILKGFSYPQKLFNYLNLHLCIWMCELADGIRAQSASICKGMTDYGIKKDKITIIPAGIDQDEFTYHSPDLNSFKVAFVGRLEDIKGAPLLLDIVKKAQYKLQNVSFLIFGDGTYRDRFSTLPNVEHVGLVSRDSLNYRLSTVPVALFFQKELGRAELEVAASGTIIIGSDVGEMSRWIKNNENGILCEQNADSYIEAINYIFTNPQVSMTLAENARAMVLRNFAWEIIGEKWITLLTKSLGRGCNES